MQKNFRRVIEDFVCELCGTKVKGDGYTNHCPICLTSKHVDINIGDRAASCGGLMEARRVSFKNGEFRQITFVCKKCGFERANKVQSGDNKELLFKLSLRS